MREIVLRPRARDDLIGIWRTASTNGAKRRRTSTSPRSKPESTNLGCIDDVDTNELLVELFDGKSI